MVQILKEEIKKRIYYAAIEEFFSHNYHLVKMKDITDRAEAPAGLIYTYYENKKDLFKTIVEPVFQEIRNDQINFSAAFLRDTIFYQVCILIY